MLEYHVYHEAHARHQCNLFFQCKKQAGDTDPRANTVGLEYPIHERSAMNQLLDVDLYDRMPFPKR